ncbi:profilin, required for normal timing of actin polymerization in response to thermal stress [Elasticomyces elasticus]|nr:profilin, required for normal timing of actin polymerization in response to thermal stress [Elasticomyces elasticus]
MSWQAYVDQSLVGTGNLDKAAIFNSDGNSVWATSPGFAVAPNEMQEIVNAYRDKGDANGVKRVQSSGLHVAGERFVVLKADERSLYGKKVHNSANQLWHQCWTKEQYLTAPQGKEGIVIVKTTQAILVTHYPETGQPGAAANTVEQLGDYLISVGY